MDDYSPSATCGSTVQGKAPGKPFRDEDSDESESVSLKEIVEDNEDQVDEDNGNNDGREETGQSGLMNGFHGRSLVPDSASNLSAPPVGATLHEHGERQINSETMATSNFVSASLEQPVYYPPDDGTDGLQDVENSSSPMRSQPLNIDHVTATWSRDNNRQSSGPPPTSVPPASAAGQLSDSEIQLPEVFWDTPGSTNVLEEYNCKSCCDTTMSVLKLVTCIVIFCSVVVLTMFSNGTLLLAASNLRPSSNYKQDQGALRCVAKSQGPQNLFCVALPRNKSGEFSTSGLTCLPPGEPVWEANDCSVHRAMWGWSLFMMVCIPYAFVFIRNLKKIVSGQYHKPFLSSILGVVLVFETFYAIGMSLFVFIVLPSVDNVIEGLLVMYGMSLGPSIMKILFRAYKTTEDIPSPGADPDDSGPRASDCNPLSRISASISGCMDKHESGLDVVSVVLQMIIIITFTVVGALQGNCNVAWSVPLSLLLTSGHHWENYADAQPRFPILQHLTKLIKEARHSRVVVHFVASAWKIVVTLLMMFVTVGMHIDFIGGSDPYLAAFNLNRNQCKSNSTIQLIFSEQIAEMELDWLWVWLIQVCSALTCYFFARSAAKMRIQRLCYALPLNLATPITYFILAVMCATFNSEPCVFTGTFPGYLFFKCYEDQDKLTYTLWLPMLVLWGLSQLWTTRHVWREPINRLTPADRLFVLPLYDVIVGQSLLINYTTKTKLKKATNQIPAVLKVMAEKARESKYRMSLIDLDMKSETQQRELIPMIYICATMWHETKEEMITMLKSIFKLDWDQWCKEKSVTSLNAFTIPDYYNFEAHIFFDDAMKKPDGKFRHETVNDFVQLFVDVINEAASKVHNVDLKLKPPAKIPTPYGGRLVWEMPGYNKLTLHLKDKAKIRPKKRWSQVMYMYYFLGHRLLQNEKINNKQTRAENTFLLALDGDIDFKPDALRLLVDLMKRDLRLGAACGRIHPTGSGPMVWYQSFEYALGHWMQKATEHVIGCVLCSPGCFSLFRGSALMDDNVMHKYTTKATEPRHYIQYDQGEDRWLCTLLLQRGYRVEYCAASDSFTQAPEEFKEFFNQRRRWIPSTMANIADLIWSWRHTTVVNENISIPYVAYQFVMLVASVIGPGTIFMMMVGALQLALAQFNFPLWASLLCNIVPVIIFVLLCFYASSETQTNFAVVLAYIYSVVQMLVLVGLLVPIATTPGAIYCNPNAIFFFLVAGTFVLCGILHPQEIMSLFNGFTYYLAIPTMYLILMIYAVCNLNNVSWGTREVKPTPSELSAEEEKRNVEELDKLKENKTARGYLAGLSDFFGLHSKGPDGNEIGLWQRMVVCCCGRRSGSKAAKLALTMELFKEVRSVKDMVRRYNRRVTAAMRHGSNGELPVELQRLVDSSSESDAEVATRETEQLVGDRHVTAVQGAQTSDQEATVDTRHQSTPPASDSVSSNGMQRPQNKTSNTKSWFEVETLGRGAVEDLDPAETEFFEGLIRKYLEPLIENEQDKEKLEIQLRDLRNKLSLGFLLVNGVFITMLFVLQSYTEELGIPWLPQVCPSTKVEPLGFTFLILFGSVILVQTTGMIAHRIGTFQHLMSITSVRKKKEEDIAKLASALGNLEDSDLTNDYSDNVETGNHVATTETDVDSDNDDRKKPIVPPRKKKMNARRLTKVPVEPRADENFEKRLSAFRKNPDVKIPGILKKASTTQLMQAIGVNETEKPSTPTRRRRGLRSRFSRSRPDNEGHVNHVTPNTEAAGGRKSVHFDDERGVSQHDRKHIDNHLAGDVNHSAAAHRTGRESPPTDLNPRQRHEQYADSKEIYLNTDDGRYSLDQPPIQPSRDRDERHSGPEETAASRSYVTGGRTDYGREYAKFDYQTDKRYSEELRTRVQQYANNSYIKDEDEITHTDDSDFV